MKRIIYILVALFFVISATSIKAETKYTDGWKPLTMVNRLCPTYIWDSWIIDDVRCNEQLNQVEIIIRHDWNDRVRQMDSDGARQFIISFVNGIFEGYIETVNGSGGEGDPIMYVALGLLFDRMIQDDASLKITLIDENGRLAYGKNMTIPSIPPHVFPFIGDCPAEEPAECSAE